MGNDRRGRDPRMWFRFLQTLLPFLKTAPGGRRRAPVNLKALEARMEYAIRHPDIFIQALKHRSYVSLSNEARIDSYERLEFLGDAALNLVVSEYLFQRFPEHEEGDLTKSKALLVNKRVLAQRADRLGLGEFVLISDGEEKSGGRSRVSILADVLESILGAILIDGGYDHARRFVLTHVLNDIDTILVDEDNHNYKGELLEFTQSHDRGMPSYALVSQSGPEHQKEFTVEVLVQDEVLGVGHGRTKKDAEQLAAREALTRIKETP